MLFTVIDLTCKLISYSLIIYGLWLLVGAPFLSLEMAEGLRKFKRQKRVRRIQELSALKENHSKGHSKLYRHLEMILLSIHQNGKSANVFNFLFLTLMIFTISLFLLFISIDDFLLGLVISILLAFLPYFFLRVRLTAVRSRTSLLFLHYFPLILQNYQSCNRDIYFAIRQSVTQIKNREMQRVFMKLMNAMQLQRSPDEFDNSIRIFIYSVHSTFAKRFGKLVIRAHLDQSDVSESFIQLDSDIRKRKTDMQMEKTKNFDTVNLGFLPLVTIPFAFYFAHSLSGILDFWYFFRQKTNLTLFILTVVGGILCVSVSFLLRKPKADL